MPPAFSSSASSLTVQFSNMSRPNLAGTEVKLVRRRLIRRTTTITTTYVCIVQWKSSESEGVARVSTCSSLSFFLSLIAPSLSQIK